MDEQREAETWLRLGGIAQNQSYGDEAILSFFVIHQRCHPFLDIVSSSAVIDGGRRVVIHDTPAGQYGSPYLPSVGDCFILSLIGI